MSQPPPVLVFSSMENAETLREGRGVGQVLLEVDRKTSLINAVDIKDHTRAGVLGFQVLNPELLDLKSRTKTNLEKAFTLMMDDWLKDIDQGMNATNTSIGILTRKLDNPLDDIPPIGPPLDERNRGIPQVLYLPPTHSEFASYEHENAPPFYLPLSDDAVKAAALKQDREAQKAWWTANRIFLEVKKQLLEDMKVRMEIRLNTVMRQTVKAESDLGSGYINFEFLHK